MTDDRDALQLFLKEGRYDVVTFGVRLSRSKKLDLKVSTNNDSIVLGSKLWPRFVSPKGSSLTIFSF